MLLNPVFSRVLTFAFATTVGTMAPFWAHSATFDYNELFGSQPQRQSAPKLNIPKIGVPTSLLPTLQAAQEALVASEFDNAERLARRVTVAAPTAPEGWHVLGLALANLEKYNESLEALAKAGSLYKRNADPFTVSGDLLLHLDRRNDAKAAYEAAAARDPRDWRAVEALGRLAEQDGDIEAAKEYYKKALGVAPANRLFPWSRLAHLFMNGGTPELAIPVLTNYVAANPEDVRGYAALGHVQLANGAAGAAEASFAKAYDLSPKDSSLLLYIARSQRTDGRNEEATATFERARSSFPEVLDVYIQLGSHHGALRNYEAALDTYDLGLIRFPDNDLLLRGVRLANQRLGRMEAAISAAEKLTIREEPAIGDVLSLAILAERADRSEMARRAYERTVELDPSNWIALNNLAALLTESDPTRAVEFASMAAEHAPDQTDVQDTLGWALFNSGDLTAAREIYDQIAAGDGAKATYLYHLGRVMIAQGDKAGGKEKLQAALDLDPGFTYSADAEERLSN